MLEAKRFCTTVLRVLLELDLVAKSRSQGVQLQSKPDSPKSKGEQNQLGSGFSKHPPCAVLLPKLLIFFLVDLLNHVQCLAHQFLFNNLQ